MIFQNNQIGDKNLESRIFYFRIGDKNLNLILTKSNKGMQRGVLLEVVLEELPTSRLEVQMMHDCTFIFLQKTKYPLVR